jgi:hypothetical protein
LRNEGQNIDGVGGEQEDAVKILRHKFSDTGAKDVDVGREQIEA